MNAIVKKVLLFAAGVVLVLWLLPTVVARTPLMAWIANRLAADVNGRVEVQSASLGWFSPIKLYGLTIVDREDQTVVDVREVRSERSLGGMLWNSVDLGRFELQGLKISVVIRDNGNNLKDVFVKYLAAGKRKRIAIAAEIADGGVSIEDARSQRSWRIDQLALDFTVPVDRSRPWELKTSGFLTRFQEADGFRLRVQLGLSGQPIEEGTALKGRLEVANLTGNKGGWPLVWQRPILVTVSARQTAQDTVVENLKFESGLLKMQASGALSHLQRSVAMLMNLNKG